MSRRASHPRLSPPPSDRPRIRDPTVSRLSEQASILAISNNLMQFGEPATQSMMGFFNTMCAMVLWIHEGYGFVAALMTVLTGEHGPRSKPSPASPASPASSGLRYRKALASRAAHIPCSTILSVRSLLWRDTCRRQPNLPLLLPQPRYRCGDPPVRD